MLLRFALCDDNPEERDALAALLREYLNTRPELTGQISVFPSGTDLLDCLRNQVSFDVYLLDIIMPKLNGIELGMQLRQQDSRCEIIYLTSSSEYAVDSYRVRAFYYLLKPIVREEFFAVLERIIESFQNSVSQKNPETLPIKTKEGFHLLPFKELLYAELRSRAVTYYLNDHSSLTGLTLRGSFASELAPLLENSCFCLCGASFCLNLSQIKAVEKSKVVFLNDSTLTIPKSGYTPLKTAWMKYWLGGR